MPTADLSTFQEERRLAALHALDLLDTAPEADYDALVALAARVLDMPTAFISLVDSERQWLKARMNIAIEQTPRGIAFCDHTVRSDAPLVVDDATLDPRFRDNPLVTQPGGIRFYAGVPIHAPDGDGASQPIGTLCVVDQKPRTLDPAALRALHQLAGLAEALVTARAAAARATEIARLADRQAQDLARNDRSFRQAERMARIGSWRYDLADDTISWSDGVYLIHGLAIGEAPPPSATLNFYPPPARSRVRDALAHTIATGEPFDIEEDFITATGALRRVRSRAECELADGMVVALVGIFQDITDRHALETQLRRSAERDELTGIANRAAFNRALEAARETAHREGTPLMLALIDLDGFKTVNDTLGHLAGDDVLKAVARRLTQPRLGDCFAARLGGDEFALIVSDPVTIADRASFIARLEDDLRMPASAGGLTIAASGTVGTAVLGPQDSVRDLVHAADTELYTAKYDRVGNRHGKPARRSAA